MNQSYKHLSNQILIGVSPNPTQIFTNSRIKLYCTKNNNIMTPVNFNVEWKRVANGLQQIITVHENSGYECSPIDLGYFIQARIKIEDEGISTEQIRKFGQIKLEPQLANLIQKSVTAELIRVKVAVQKINIDLIIKLNQTGLTFLSKQNFEYSMKVDSISDIQIKLDTKAISLKLKQYSQTIVKYISVIVKYPIKIKIEALDIIFESRSRRDYFILMMKKLLYRKTITNASHFQREESYIKGREAYLSNNHHFISRPRVSSEPHELSISRKKVEKKASKKQRIEENDIMKDLESKELFSDFTQKKQQDALNLRDSFNQMQEKYLKQKGQMQSDSNIDEIKLQLDEARKSISKLMEENQILKDQNNNLKQTLSNSQNTNMGRQILNLRQKIQYLSIENQRLQAQRTQIIADKIGIEIKYQKEKQQKESLKQKLMLLTNNPIKVQTPKKIQFKNPITKSLHPIISNMSQSTKQPTIDYSRSMNDLKQVSSEISLENPKQSLKPVFKRTESYITLNGQQRN